jgi:hypothetical protein
VERRQSRVPSVRTFRRGTLRAITG